MKKSETPRTDKFFQHKVQLQLNAEDFASPSAQQRVIAKIESVMLECRLFSRQLERELKQELHR